MTTRRDHHGRRSGKTATDPDAWSVDPAAVANQLHECGVTHIATVPDYVMLSVYRVLAERDRSPAFVPCSTEDDAVAVAAGLYVGGAMPIVMMQNQGLFASMNTVRAVGLDARLPLFMLIGQFGREYRNLGRPASESARAVVRGTERLLDALDIDYVCCDRDDDVAQIGDVCRRAFERSTPTAAIIGHYTAWRRGVAAGPGRSPW